MEPPALIAMGDVRGAFSSEQSWPAPAKINLFLHINGRRPDGYHELQTLFQFLEYGDELEFDVRTDGEIHRIGGLGDVPQEQDLVVRAARALQQATDCRLGADIRVLKRIPAGAGLGGGSSDAAPTLAVLNQLWELDLAAEQLAAIGLRLGADVPIFLHGHAAWAEGVGERLVNCEPDEHWYLLVTPRVHVSTALVFGHPDLPRGSPRISPTDYQFEHTRNDCEALVRTLHPAVDEALNALTDFGPCRMSGTGCAAYAMFRNRAAAQAAFAQLSGRWPMQIARGCNVSPLALALSTRASP